MGSLDIVGGGGAERQEAPSVDSSVMAIVGNTHEDVTRLGPPFVFMALPPGGGQSEKKDSPEAVVDDFLNSLQLETAVTPEQRGELARLMVAALTGRVSPDEHESLLQKLVDQLKAWGYEPTDINAASLVAESAPDRLASQVNELVTRSKMPTLQYPSNVGVYGFTAEVTDDGRMLYTQSMVDKTANAFENWLRDAGDTGSYFKKKFRGKVGLHDVRQNVEALGLSDHFEAVGEGEKVTGIAERIEDVQQGAFLDDLLRLQQEHPFLQNLDRAEALRVAAQMVEKVHTDYQQGIGELLGNDIVLQVGDDGTISGARLALPDMQYEEEVPLVQRQALDMLDLCFSVGTAGFQTGEEESGEDRAREYIGTVLNHYSRDSVKVEMKRLLGEGVPHDTMHNGVRFGFDRVKNKKEVFGKIGSIIEEFAVYPAGRMV